ncbi:MAG TPA: hypothetical protein VEW46_05665 [Pyrinomonadaceae bacterium]|nr:hypothetical protein [Pyrinomonadaceae bacterium]
MPDYVDALSCKRAIAQNLAVIEPIIRASKRIPSEHSFDVDEVQPMTREIGSALSFVSFKPHTQCSYKL